MSDGKWILKVKYSPDQPRDPEGSPTGGQWTSGGGTGRSAVVHTTGMNEEQLLAMRQFLPKTTDGGFDDKGEYLKVLRPTSGSGDAPREGIGRAQVERYYARKNATKAAMMTRYRNEPGRTVQQAVDQAIKDGYTQFSRTGRYTMLSRNEGDALQFKSKIDMDYIDTVLNRGDFARNY